MYSFEIAIPIKKLEKVKDVIKKGKERYEEIINGLSSYDPIITEHSTILCKKCGKRSQVKNVEFGRYYWYETPYGCTGGDCWHMNGFIIVCPKCGEWEHVHEASKTLPNFDEQKMEFRIMKKLLRFAQQRGDVHYSNGEYKFTEKIEQKYETQRHI